MTASPFVAILCRMNTIEANGRRYRWMAEPLVVVCVDGCEYAYLTEAGIYQKFDSAAQAWQDQGGVIELSGKSKNCSWDTTAAACR